jgi:ribonuclease HI
VICYTDGACSGNGYANSTGGFGVIILDDNENYISSYSKGTKDTTNNREELKAILYVLLKYGKTHHPIVYSDSAYAVNTFNNWMWGWARRGWTKSDNKTPENLDLIQAFYEYWNKGYRIDLRKCVGHGGVKWNEAADKLAVAAKEGVKL